MYQHSFLPNIFNNEQYSMFILIKNLNIKFLFKNLILFHSFLLLSLYL